MRILIGPEEPPLAEGSFELVAPASPPASGGG
jgi:hypothetical protein